MSNQEDRFIGNDMNPEPIYIDIKTVAELKGITTRAVRLSINKYKYRKVQSRGGKSYEILLSSLEEKFQQKYKEQFYQEIVDIEKNIMSIEKPAVEKKDFYPDSAKQIAFARLDLINEWNDFREKNKPKTQADKTFIELYNSGEYLKNIYEIIGSTSRGALQRWNQSYKEYGNWEGLIPRYKYSSFSEYNTILTEEEIGIFLKILLHPNKFNIGKAIKLTRHILIKRRVKDIPQSITFRRYAEWFKKTNYDKWVLMREGEKALQDKVLPYIIRDVSKLKVGQVLVADGHRLNFEIISPFTGKSIRAVIIGFFDWKSGYLAGYEIMLEENTQCIASALRMAIINLDMIPDIVYQDNGAAFKAKYFSKSAGFEEAGFSGIYENLGIKSVYARPYNARAKVIERFFKEFQEEFEKLLPSYIGSSIENKPARLKRNEKFHKHLHKKISKGMSSQSSTPVSHGYVPTVKETIALINCWLEFRHSQPCSNVKGKTIQEVFDSREKQNIDKNKLNDLMMAHEVKTIHRNGIRFLSTDYYSEVLYGLKGRVIIKYSLFDLSKIKVYSIKGEYLCTAKRVTSTHPMAYHMGTIKDMEDFKQKIKKPKRLRKRTLNSIKKFLPKDEIKFLETQLEEDYLESINKKESKQNQTKATKEQVPKLTPLVFNNNYERFDYLQAKKEQTDEESAWVNRYKTTQEYKELYE